MRKVLVSLVMISALLVSSIGSTMAVWTHKEEILGNTITTGQIEIVLQGLTSGEIDKPLNITGLFPGEWSKWGRVEVKNAVNSTPVKVYFYVENVVGDACSKVNIELKMDQVGQDQHNQQQHEHSLYSGLLSNVTGDVKRVELTGDHSTLDVNHLLALKQKVQLDNSADDTFQNKTCTWTEVFKAETSHVEHDD